MNQFSRYNIFLLMIASHLLAFLGFGYMILTHFSNNNGAWLIEGLLLLAMVLNVVFYVYFRKQHHNQSK